MHWQRTSGIAFIAAGALLLGCWMVPTAYGKASAHLAVAAFRAQGRSNGLWDGARILAYEKALGVTMPVPQAILRVPKVGIEVPVYEGTSDLVLNRGAGHIPGTDGIAGHRDGFFRGLKDVTVGDRIEMQRNSGTETYVVEKTRVVLPSDTSVLASKDRARLTLVTCFPFYYVGAAPERFIVQARLVGKRQVQTQIPFGYDKPRV